jgi:seryl-tRNA synthetase
VTIKNDIEENRATTSLINTSSIQSQNDIKGLTSDIVSMNDKIKYIISEPDEIEKRKSSIIIKGIPETPDEDIPRKVKQVLDVIKVEDNPKFSRRLGEPREDKRSRPIRVIFEKEASKFEVLTKAKTLRDTPSDDLTFNPAVTFIAPDLTKLQREREYNKRVDRRRNRDDPRRRPIIQDRPGTPNQD